MRTQQTQSKTNIPHIVHAQYTHPITVYDVGWLYELFELIGKHNELGISQDVVQMSLKDVRGVYLFVKRYDGQKAKKGALNGLQG